MKASVASKNSLKSAKEEVEQITITAPVAAASVEEVQEVELEAEVAE